MYRMKASVEIDAVAPTLFPSEDETDDFEGEDITVLPVLVGLDDVLLTKEIELVPNTFVVFWISAPRDFA